MVPIRKKLDSRMLITSGIRSASDYQRLKDKGYNPSLRSDHMLRFQTEANGQIFNQSVGACDFVCLDIPTEEAFWLIYNAVQS